MGFEFPDPPAPEGITEVEDELQFRDPNQPRLNIYFWKRTTPPPPNPPTVLLFIHGIGEHALRYRPFFHNLLTRTPSLAGIASYDQRGHGRSGGAPGSVTELDHLANDFIEHFSSRAAMEWGTDVRVILGGHSLGGMVCLQSIKNAKDDWLKRDGYATVVGVLLSAPAVKVVVAGMVNKALASVAPLIMRIPGSRRVIKGNGIEYNILTHCPKEIEKAQNDTQFHGLVTLGLASDMLQAGNSAVRWIKSTAIDGSCLLTQVPVLICHGNEDKVCDIQGSKNLVEALGNKENVKLQVVEGAFHEMHNEDKEHGKELFEHACVEFLQAICTKNE